MVEEYLDVVNENDVVIGKAKRSECHKNSLIHRSVFVFVFNSRHQLCLQKRSRTKDLYGGYYTGSATGHVNSGEAYKNAAIRELKEELGVENIKLKEICKFKNFTDSDKEITKLFVSNYDGEIVFNREEIESGGFYDLEIIERNIEKNELFLPDFTPHFKNALKQYLGIVGG